MQAAEQRWDVVVIGAGPSGATAALVAARAGARTVVLERGDVPRYKTCGGGLIGPSLANLPPGMVVPARQEVDVALITYRGRAGVRARGRAAGRLLPLVDRADLDAALVAEAVAAGAVLHPNTAVRALEPLADGTGIRVLTGSGEYVADAVVGADGTSGRVGRYVGVELAEVDVGLEAEVPLPPAQRGRWADTLQFDWGPLPTSYAWVFPKGDRLTVGVIAERADGTAAREYLDAFLVQSGLDGVPGTTRSGHLTRCRTPTSPLSRGRVLVAGDAAGLLEPWTREGISFALRSGRLAGTAAAEMVGAGTTAVQVAAAAARYDGAVARTLTPEMAAGRELRRAQGRHPAVFHAVFAVPATRRVFADVVTGRTDIARVFDHRWVRLLSRVLQRV